MGIRRPPQHTTAVQVGSVMRLSDQARDAVARYATLAQAYPEPERHPGPDFESLVGRPVRPRDGQSELDAMRAAWRQAMASAVNAALGSGVTKASLRGHRGPVPRRVLDELIRQPRGDPASLILKSWPVVIAHDLFLDDMQRLEQAGQGRLAAELMDRARPLFRDWATATATIPPQNGRHPRAPDLRAAYEDHLATAREQVRHLIPR